MLKKILPQLHQSLLESGISEPNELQRETWTAIKSGVDCAVVAGEGYGKSTVIAMHAVQRLQKPEGESTRALIIVENKEKLEPMVALIKQLAGDTGLRVYGVHEKGDIDFDKNHISLGLDILVGTPTKINTLFSSAGFNATTIRFFAVDDADFIFRNREDSIILRLLTSIERTQKIFMASAATEKFEIMVDKTMEEPLFFDFTEE